MAMQWFEKFIDNLAKILNEPPYLLFVFISVIFVIIALLTQKNFESTWRFFLYAVAGTIWRYAERDLLGISRDWNKKTLKLIALTIYHLGNFALFFILLKYLNLF